MASVAGRSGSVQTSRRSSLGRSGRSSCTHTARTTRPFRKRAATRQVRYRTTSSWPYRTRALRWTGSASTFSRVIRLPRHPRAVLARPTAAAAPRRPRDGVEREVAAHAAGDGVAVGERGLDQPGAHEPGVEQEPHPAEPAAEQAHEEARARELAAVGAAADQAQHQRHRADPPPVLDDRGQAQPALAGPRLTRWWEMALGW